MGVDVVFKGLMAAESHMRLLSFATRGYVFESSRPHAPEFFHVSPLGIWRDEDIWEYIHRFNVPYSPLYDIEYTNIKGQRCRIKRNGCVGCATDIAFKDNHFSALRKTHPDMWEFYMQHGMADQLIALQKYKSNGKINFLNRPLTNGERALQTRPCEFDEIGEHIEATQLTFSDYDPEELSI